MTELDYWLWLTSALGAGVRSGDILEVFRSPRAVYNSTEADRRLSGVFTPSQLKKLSSVPVDVGEKIRAMCSANGWEILTSESADYPELLNHIDNPPLVLFVMGTLKGINNHISIGVVGTRNPSPDSVRVARALSANMASCGAVIVSGGAFGIDSAAHEGALVAGGRTVSVMGCGLNDRYIRRNAALYSEIINNGGAVISEFVPDAPPGKSTFPIRNRIISGMSRGVLVVEAGERSGSIITAGCAAEQGRDVFSVPGNVVSSDYAGANKLIRDGAKPVFVAEDVIDEYRVMYPDMLHAPEQGLEEKLKTYTTVGGYAVAPAGLVQKKPEKKAERRTLPQDYDKNAEKVYSLLSDEPAYPADIAAKAGLNVSAVVTAMTVLELDDLAQKVSGGRYALK